MRGSQMNNTTIEAPVVSEKTRTVSNSDQRGILKLPSFMTEFLQEDVRTESSSINTGSKDKPVMKKISTLVFRGKHLNVSLDQTDQLERINRFRKQQQNKYDQLQSRGG